MGAAEVKSESGLVKHIERHPAHSGDSVRKANYLKGFRLQWQVEVRKNSVFTAYRSRVSVYQETFDFRYFQRKWKHPRRDS